MSNSFFQFKEFRVEQGNCSMKVSTDACIQGAWTPVDGSISSVLDIGTGTGLLSLMLAQRSPSIQIDAIESDTDASTQATENIASSPWAKRINILAGDVRTFPFSHKYDMVICNPPFFHNSLLGPDDRRNSARHNISLSLDDLLNTLENVLANDGHASILLPFTEHQHWQHLLEARGWSILRRLMVHPKKEALPNRIISLCARGTTMKSIEESLTIYETPNHYTPGFKYLLKDYYLHL